MGKDAQAFEHLLAQRDLYRKILDEQEAARISGLRTAYAAQQREARITALQAREAAERARSRLLEFALGAVIVLMLVTSIGLLLRARGHRVIVHQKNELERAYVKMEELSRTDALTGLPNRRDALLHLKAEITRSLRSGEMFALGMIDIDGFKAINDRFGHQVGDHVLTGIAQALRRCLREPDYVARWGGDEFLVVLSMGDASGLEAASERIHAAIAQVEAHPSGGSFRPTVSCGFVRCCGGQPNDWLVRADEALYRAKQKGKNVSEIVLCKPV